jgi:hypothetical protein
MLRNQSGPTEQPASEQPRQRVARPGGPFRVKRVTLTAGRSLPVFPDKQTFSQAVGMSQTAGAGNPPAAQRQVEANWSGPIRASSESTGSAGKPASTATWSRVAILTKAFSVAGGGIAPRQVGGGLTGTRYRGGCQATQLTPVVPSCQRPDRLEEHGSIIDG